MFHRLYRPRIVGRSPNIASESSCNLGTVNVLMSARVICLIYDYHFAAHVVVFANNLFDSINGHSGWNRSLHAGSTGKIDEKLSSHDRR